VPTPDLFAVADPRVRNLGYGIGAGAYRLSAHAIAFPERFGPLASTAGPGLDVNTSQVFRQDVAYQTMGQDKHRGYHQSMFVRAEMCAACHDVTNALPIKNKLGRWVGGFPIERTYTEWSNSRYADRPGNTHYDPRFKRDCQSCHMQQDYGQPGTAQTLYHEGLPLPIPSEPVSTGGPPRPFFAHHFVGGNALVPRLIGKDVDRSGNVAPYPELSVFSFSSADHKSPYSRAYWTHLERKGAYAQQARLAWDRLRHVLSLEVEGPARATAGTPCPSPSPSPTPAAATTSPPASPRGAWAGWPCTPTTWPPATSCPSRIASGGAPSPRAWAISPPRRWSIRASPAATGRCPAGSPDPWAVQFKAVASLGDGCPTLDLPYAAPLNMVTNQRGLPIDASGRIIDADNPTGLPQFRDDDRNGDLFDESYLRDWRLKPMPHEGASRKLDRYAVVVPSGTRGPIAVSAAVYYQSVEAVVAMKFLGNMTETNRNMVLEPCVLGGLCDGRTPSHRAGRGRGRAPRAHGRPQLGGGARRRRRGRPPPDRDLSGSGRGPGVPGRGGEGLLLAPRARRGHHHLHAHRRRGRSRAGLGRSDRRRGLGAVPQPGPAGRRRPLHRPAGGGRVRARRRLHHRTAGLELHRRERAGAGRGRHRPPPRVLRRPPGFLSTAGKAGMNGRTS
jgi:hypothetical protein